MTYSISFRTHTRFTPSLLHYNMYQRSPKTTPAGRCPWATPMSIRPGFLSPCTPSSPSISCGVTRERVPVMRFSQAPAPQTAQLIVPAAVPPRDVDRIASTAVASGEDAIILHARRVALISIHANYAYVHGSGRGESGAILHNNSFTIIAARPLERTNMVTPSAVSALFCRPLSLWRVHVFEGGYVCRSVDVVYVRRRGV